MKVAVIGKIRQEGVRLLEERGDIETVLLEEAPPATLAKAMGDVDAILVRTASITDEVIKAAPKLKVVSRHGVGYDNVDLDALNRRRIPLCVAATANMVAVAEHAFAMILALAKDLRGLDRAVREHDWGYRFEANAVEVFGHTLLLVGFGRTGQALARRAQGFGMRVVVHDPHVDDSVLDQMGCERAALLDGSLGEADVVSLHVPLNEQTANLLDAGRIGLMKEGAILVNTSRGGLVDEAALAHALRTGRIKGAGIDVFVKEPPPASTPLLKQDNALFSPHSAGVTDGALLRMALEAAANIIAVLDGRHDAAVIVNAEAIRERD